MENSEKPIIERDQPDEDLDVQDDNLETTRKNAKQHNAGKDKEWDGPEKEEFRTRPDGEEAPPGSPEHDRGIISGS